MANFNIHTKITVLSVIMMLFLGISNADVLAQQKFPATVNFTVTPPYSPFLNDYTGSVDDNKMRATLVFNDNSVPSWPVRLRLRIEGPGLTLQTKSSFIPAEPITLVPGTANQLTATDLAPYFNINNLEISGISRNEFIKKGTALTEGPFTFCFEVVSYESGNVISAPGCATTWIKLFSPPLIVSPACDSYVSTQEPQIINFQWQSINSSSPEVGLNVQYKLHLYELTDQTINPLSAFNNSKYVHIYESDLITATNFVYGNDKPALEAGKTYIYQIQAVDSQGKGIFKNDGMSEICWFHFGWPEGGKIDLIFPGDKQGFAKRDQVYFSWSAPDNLMKAQGQLVSYKFKIVEVEAGQTKEEALQNNVSWYEETTASNASSSWTINFPQGLEEMGKYAWRVTAHSDGQETAESDVFEFTGPPVIENFYAGSHKVFVTQTDNRDLTKLTGKGYIYVAKDGSDTVFVQFEDIRLKQVGLNYILEEGQVYNDFKEPWLKPVQANYNEDYSVFFLGERLLLDKNRLKFKGKVEWDLPIAVDSEEQPKVVSKTGWFYFDTFELLGEVQLSDGNTFILLDPYEFTLKLDTTSTFKVLKDNMEMKFNGRVIFPEQIKSTDKQRTHIEFKNQDQLEYLQIETEADQGNISLLNNSDLALVPREVILDFSEQQSPFDLEGRPSWKGAVFKTFSISSKARVDFLNQLSLYEPFGGEFEYAYDTAAALSKASIGSTGLLLELSKVPENNELLFNSFPSRISWFHLVIKDNLLETGTLKGNFKIPVLSESEDFTFSIPIDKHGFRMASIDGIEGKTFVFNKGGHEQEMEVTVTRAVPQNNSFFDFTMDIYWPALDTRMSGVQGFRAWGNYDIGFYKPNGIRPLDNQIKGAVKEFPVTCDYVGAGREGGVYSIGLSCSINLADDISGESGPPRSNLYSVMANDLLDEEVNLSDRAENFNEYSGGGDLGLSYSEQQAVDNKRAVLTSGIIENWDGMVSEANAQLDLGEGNDEDSPDDDDSGLSDFREDLEKGITDKLNESHPSTNTDLTERLGRYMTALVEEDSAEVQELFTLIASQITSPLTKRIVDNRDKVVGKINEVIDSVTMPVNKDIEKAVKAMVGSLKDGLVEVGATAGLDVEVPMTRVSDAIAFSVYSNVEKAINNSIDKNLKGPLIRIPNQMSDTLINYLNSAVVATIWEIYKGKKPESALNFFNGMPGLVGGIGENLKNNVGAVKDSAAYIARDIFTGISPQSILTQMRDSLEVITAELLADKAGDLIEEGIEDALGDIPDFDIGIGLDFDFDNLLDKLRAGDIGGIVKIEDVKIDVNTKYLRFKGFASYKNDDPTFGNVWVAALNVYVKKPREFGVAGQFVTGKKDDQSYWFVQVSTADEDAAVMDKIEVQGLRSLNEPVSFGAVKLVAAAGRVYSKMTIQENKKIVPDPSNNYGAQLELLLADSKDNMKLLLAGSYISYQSQNSGNNEHTIEMMGYFEMGPKKPLTPNADGAILIDTENSEAEIQAGVKISYNSEEKHFIGGGFVTISKPGMVCMDGSFFLETKPGFWHFALGSREEKVIVIPACRGWGGGGWLDITNQNAEVGVGLAYGVAAEEGFKFKKFKIKVKAEAHIAGGVVAALQYKPDIVIHRAGLWADLYAAVRLEYDAWFKSGSITVAELSCSADLLMIFDPSPVRMEGQIRGEVKVIGFGIPFNAGFEHEI